MSLADIVPAGVVTGDNLVKLLEHAKDNGYAIPAFNCTRYAFVCVFLCRRREIGQRVRMCFTPKIVCTFNSNLFDFFLIFPQHTMTTTHTVPLLVTLSWKLP